MVLKIRSLSLWILICVQVFSLVLAQDGNQFVHYNFSKADLHRDGMATIDDGRLHLTNNTNKSTGHAFHKIPMNFTRSSPSSLSFSTEFVFAMFPLQGDGQGLAFVVSPSMDLRYSGAATSYLGLFNRTNDNKTENHILAVELDTNPSSEAIEDSYNHVGIDVNSIVSVESADASYFNDTSRKNISLPLASGTSILVWIDYDGLERLLNVTLAPASLDQQAQSKVTNISLHGVSRKVEKQKALTFQRFWIPQIHLHHHHHLRRHLLCHQPLHQRTLLIVLGGVLYLLYKKKKYAEVLEQWEKEYSPQRYSFRNLYKATKGFKENQLLGAGGFGKVYKGILPSGTQIAVKRVYHDAEQGMKQYVAEIASMGRLRHKNLVQLLGYCRRKGELLLVYEYMPNGSLDNYLFNNQNLTWSQRLNIIKGVASALFNILLDADLNGRLGDFGFARFHDRGENLEATRVVGTIGYMAPELTAMGVTTTWTDVYAFGAFILEVVCGRRPVDPERPPEQMILLKWVAICGSRDSLMVTVDSKLEGNFKAEEVKMLLKLGMLCSQSNPENRPSMRLIVQYLEGNVTVPSISYDTSGFGMPNISNETVTQQPGTSSLANFSFEDVTVLYGGR
ncbi:hypothetical protein HID58_088275 [Brassica napus]|uniref:non-specific serine/threonine protein kinase n=2 Tax=Brassica napus TaxID=3708 RepID=A0ABQ7XVR2_BRANA|nr:hypothetical protein HID58_088275 [Brassica napus]CDY54246.1 BnaC09g53850D [Brassica napus]